jgi:hypothetical protein
MPLGIHGRARRDGGHPRLSRVYPQEIAASVRSLAEPIEGTRQDDGAGRSAVAASLGTEKLGGGAAGFGHPGIGESPVVGSVAMRRGTIQARISYRSEASSADRVAPDDLPGAIAVIDRPGGPEVGRAYQAGELVDPGGAREAMWRLDVPAATTGLRCVLRGGAFIPVGLPPPRPVAAIGPP